MSVWTPWGIIWVIVILSLNPTGNTPGGSSDDGPPGGGGVIGPP